MTKIDLPLREMLEEFAPKFRSRQIKGWFWTVVVTGVSTGSFYFLKEMHHLDAELRNAPIILGLLSLWGVNRWVIRGKQQLIMPHLARSAGLEYRQDGRAFFADLPPRLLPHAPFRDAEDFLSGQIQGRDFAFCELLLKSGGKRQKTRFRGYVLHFSNINPMPAFFVAQLEKTSLVFGKIDVSGLIETQRFKTENDIEYGVWLSEQGLAQRDPTLSHVIDILMSLEARVQGNGQMFSATSTGEEVYVAISHRPNLFRIGGLLASQKRIASGVEKAIADLNVPLQGAAVLLEAEERATQESGRIASKL